MDGFGKRGGYDRSGELKKKRRKEEKKNKSLTRAGV